MTSTFTVIPHAALSKSKFGMVITVLDQVSFIIVVAGLLGVGFIEFGSPEVPWDAAGHSPQSLASAVRCLCLIYMLIRKLDIINIF